MTETNIVRQLLWEEATEPIWQPISMRFVQEEEFYFFAEVRNVSDTPKPSPLITIELLIEGQSYGVEEMRAENAWVLPGESAFFQMLNFFGSSLTIGDWDEEIIAIAANPHLDIDPELYQSIRVEGDRVYNDGTVPIAEAHFREIVRDEAGIYVASCMGPYTGAVIPPGRSVRAQGLDDTSDPGGCGFTMAGEPASVSLGIGDEFTAEYVLAYIDV